jgi:hypothetical protein
MSQANVSRSKAVKALKNNSNDIVNAIMVSWQVLSNKWILMDGLKNLLNRTQIFEEYGSCKNEFDIFCWCWLW